MSAESVPNSLEECPRRIVIIGGSGGIGQAMVEELLQRFPAAEIAATYFRTPGQTADDRLQWHQLDVREPLQIEALAADFERVDWIINCAGFLHGDLGGPEKNIRSLQLDFLLENIKINTLPTLLLARYFASALKLSPAPVLATVSARVGSIEDNRLGGWYSYRIS